MMVDENKIEEDHRIPRVTSATWKYESGAVGSLTHAVALKGTLYSTELEIYADGYQIRLLDPYNNPTLRVRYGLFIPPLSYPSLVIVLTPCWAHRNPDSDVEEVHVFSDDVRTISSLLFASFIPNS
jgi:hypothetical protein